ncbi:MAG TPA: ABC transporter ATP-binding protein, partial [Candidatus Cloacimonadota bacterium]|nr:ABC transporter ATP-binding protein [Candidatus Cloacimonadota bacterium]
MRMGGGGPGGRGFVADDVKGKIYDRRLYARLLFYLKPYLKWVLFSLFVLLFVAGAEVIIPLIQRTAIDDLIVSNRSLLIFEDEAMPQAFVAKYKLPAKQQYRYENKNFVIVKSRDRNKINKIDLDEVAKQGYLTSGSFYIIKSGSDKIELLNRYLPQVKQPHASKKG